MRGLEIALCISSFCCLLVSCSGGVSPTQPTGPTGPQPDFSLSVQPGTTVIAPSGTQSAEVTVSGLRGFDGNVQVTATSPSGVSISPNSFSVSTSTPQQLTISASASVSPGTVTISFSGTSGTLTHSAQLQVEVDLPVTSTHPPFRTRYLRTDAQYNPNALEYFPPHFTVYDSVHGHLFVSNPFLNRIDVFDDATESQVGSIIVPFVWGIDITPGGTTMYAATAFGDVYLIDPVGMAVLQRFPSASLGSQGYMPNELFILANGQLVLFGSLVNVDGSQTFAIWDPTTNSFQLIYPGIFGNAAFQFIGQLALTVDRTMVVMASADSDGTLGLYNPSTGAAVSGRAAGIVSEILPTPDGSRIFMCMGSYFEVHDANSLALLGSFTASGFGGTVSALLSYDGSSLFAVDTLGDVTAYNTNTYAQEGWVPNFDVFDFQQSIVLSAADSSGLVIGPIGHGVAFLDTTQIKPGLAATSFDLGFLSPGTGSRNGGSAVKAEVSEPNASSPENITSATIYIGNVSANNVAFSNGTIDSETVTALTPPASAGGPADFTLVLPDGSMQLNPENFSFGPTIVELSTNASSADGGGEGVIFGYGLGQQPSDVAVSVGGQSAPVTQVIPSVAPISPYPFPMEAILFTIPSGVAGSTAAVMVSTTAGTATSGTPLNYVPAVQQYPLRGAALMQGVYDPAQSVVYFTDQSQIDVFSTSSDNWLSPITIPYTNANSRLMGVALSQDGNTLAVSDAGNESIYVLNPSSPSTVKSFSVQSNLYPGYEPYGLTVSNSGIVYYYTYNGPQYLFHMLNTNTGTITDFAFGGGSNPSPYQRLLISPGGDYVYGGIAFVLNTATNAYAVGYQAEYVPSGDGADYNFDMALSQDGSTLLTDDALTDATLNMRANIAYVDRDTWLPVAVYGQKLNSDGTLIFQPLTNGIDELNGSTGLLAYRVALPIQIANAYDALVIDNTDNLLFAITPTGIAEINLSSLPAPSSKQLRSSAIRSTSAAIVQSNARFAFKGQQWRKVQSMRPHLRHLTSLPDTAGKRAKIGEVSTR